MRKLLLIALLTLLVVVSFLTHAGRQGEGNRPAVPEGERAPQTAAQVDEKQAAPQTAADLAGGGRVPVTPLRLRVELVGGPAAPVDVRGLNEGGEVLSLTPEGQEGNGWRLAEGRLLLHLSAPGYAPELVALERDEERLVRLEALGEVKLLAAGREKEPTEGVLGFLVFPFAASDRGTEQRRLRYEEGTSLAAGTLAPEVFEVVFDSLREAPYDPLDRVLATLGNADLSAMTDADGVARWEGVPPIADLAIELDTDCRCFDPENRARLTSGPITRTELLTQEREERSSARFDVAPGASVVRTFFCEASALVRGRIAPFGPGTHGKLVVRDVRSDLQLDGARSFARNEKAMELDDQGRFAAVVKPGRKRLSFRWVEDGCTFTRDREILLSPGADVDVGVLEPPTGHRSITLRPTLTDAIGQELRWSDYTTEAPPTISMQYRVLVDDSGLLDDPRRAATEVHEASCRIGESVQLCGLPPGELNVTTLIDWPGGGGAPEGMALRRGAGTLQRIPVREGAPSVALVPFVTEVSYSAAIVIHDDGDLAPRSGEQVVGTLLRVGAGTRLTSTGQRDAHGGLSFEFNAPAGPWIFYAQLPGTRSRAGHGIYVQESVLVGQTPRLDAAWSRGVRVELESDEPWDPARQPIALLLRDPAGDVTYDVIDPDAFDGVPPGSGVDLTFRGQGFLLGAGADVVRIPLE
ncbi:MAG: hypothetical protein AAF682_27365 [Planctomycetota bacterium]